MPTFDFDVSKRVKVTAPSFDMAKRALAAHAGEALSLPAKKEKHDLFGTIEINPVQDAFMLHRVKGPRKAKKAPPVKDCPPEGWGKEKPPQSAVDGGCCFCLKPIEEGQPVQKIEKDGITYDAHSVCAAAGGAT